MKMRDEFDRRRAERSFCAPFAEEDRYGGHGRSDEPVHEEPHRGLDEAPHGAGCGRPFAVAGDDEQGGHRHEDGVPFFAAAHSDPHEHGEHPHYGDGRGIEPHGRPIAGEESGEPPRGRHGHSRSGRIFEHGEMRLVLLALVNEKPSYGYELIKAIEERLNGAYAPSPGLIYPTLTLLEEMGYATAEAADNGKKLYTTTAAGQAYLAASQPLVSRILGRMEQAAAEHRRREAPQLVRAMQNLRCSLQLKCQDGNLTEEQLRSIAAALDEAAVKIEQS